MATVVTTPMRHFAIGPEAPRDYLPSISSDLDTIPREEPAKNVSCQRIWRLGVGLILVCSLLGSSLPLRAQDSVSKEYQSKARVLANLANFIEWPETAFSSRKTTFSVCVIGEFGFGIFLADLVKGRTTHGRPIQIRWLKKDPEVQTCQILFVSRSESKRYAQIMNIVQGSNILTIGETSSFLDSGGAIVFSFMEKEQELRFDVNLVATNAAHLKISSNLLALARRVLNIPEAAKS